MIVHGANWDDDWDLAKIEIEFVRGNGFIVDNGKKYGHGLFFHFKRLQQLLWPEGEDHHRWSDDILRTILENRISVIAGCRDSGKTNCLSRYALTDYFCWPECTLTLMSSTHSKGLQLRAYGNIKELLSRAQALRPWLPGNIVESELGIFTDKLSYGQTVRDWRRGLICVPVCGGEGENLEGLAKFIGVKQTRRRLIGDECQFMDAAYLNVMSNLDKGEFKGVFCGNFLGQGDPLDRLAEPVNGWSSMAEPKKTITWENRLGGVTLNLIGFDSPNFDVPEGEPVPYPYLISRDDAERVKKRYGADSLQYWSQIKGIRKADLMAHRILTMEICRAHNAFEPVIWRGDETTKVYALDAAFGGDRAVGGILEFGKDVKGKTVIKCHKHREIHFQISSGLTIEEQLANAVRDDCRAASIPPSNVFFDAGMRATLGVQMANTVGLAVNAINFGGPATDRPVSKDDFIIDKKTKERRLKKCSEAYSKFVTELAYSVRMVVESDQMREISEEAVREFEMREWTTVPGDRIELETKAETKKRMGRSPDVADFLSIGVDGARRLGFVIEGLKDKTDSLNEDKDWLEKLQAKYRKFERKFELRYGRRTWPVRVPKWWLAVLSTSDGLVGPEPDRQYLRTTGDGDYKNADEKSGYRRQVQHVPGRGVRRQRTGSLHADAAQDAGYSSSAGGGRSGNRAARRLLRWVRSLRFCAHRVRFSLG